MYGTVPQRDQIHRTFGGFTTHPHANHLMASCYLKEQTGAPTAIGEKISEIADLWRDERDATLALPDRMLHALQVNLRAEKLPEPEADGHRYFKIPANKF